MILNILQKWFMGLIKKETDYIEYPYYVK